MIEPQYTIEIWDRTSPINDIPAKDVLEIRDDIPKKGDVYLIYQDGQLLFFQPHDPITGGPIRPGRGQAIAEAHVAMLRAAWSS